jgi:hypothetical protein
MPIHLLRERATPAQMTEMLAELGSYIKFAVDIQRNIAVGGGELHADCEKILLEDGSRQEDIWGADWDPFSQTVKFEALMNIRPRQNNPAMQILDPAIRAKVEAALRPLMEQIE